MTIVSDRMDGEHFDRRNLELGQALEARLRADFPGLDLSVFKNTFFGEHEQGRVIHYCISDRRNPIVSAKVYVGKMSCFVEIRTTDRRIADSVKREVDLFNASSEDGDLAYKVADYGSIGTAST